jgi:hypothetical protein
VTAADVRRIALSFDAPDATMTRGMMPEHSSTRRE